MPQILFYGWQVGYRKVSSTKLFQRYFHASLKQAFGYTNTVLAKQSFILPVETAEEAAEVLAHFQAIGTLCRLVEPAD
ncbi:hypothetical protein [Hymenobacter defluvii]|uniref:SPOR domain-containing protein n=1 Tax=Hymenobacter defluvii TaxID=2054411 RepID=A0ABS3TKI3_9BACT|nr:hypothetical protein [Hymenobacter defluvii]MBO3273225.1 hypothetical protein [Hymenobacter defluvii]